MPLLHHNGLVKHQNLHTYPILWPWLVKENVHVLRARFEHAQKLCSRGHVIKNYVL